MANTFVAARESTENISSSRRVRDVSKQIHYLDPEVAPFTLLTAKARKRTAVNAKFEWIEKTEPEKLDSLNDAGVTTGTVTGVTVDNGTRWQAGYVGQNLSSGEKFLVTAVSTNDLTIVRSVGDTAATNWTDGDDLMIIGTSYPEGDGTVQEVTHQETYPYNYCQIFKSRFGVTGTEMVSENYTGKDRPRLRREKMREHKKDIERAMLFGERDLFTTGSDSTNKPRRFMGGFEYYATSNAKTSIGTLTEPEFEDWTEDLFAHVGGSDTRVLFASPLVVSVIDQLAAGRLQMVPKDKTYGIAINQWHTSHGTLLIAKHRLLESGATFGYNGQAFAVEPSKCAYVTLPGRDTKLREDVQHPNEDAVSDEYLTECGLEIANPELHGIASGITG